VRLEVTEMFEIGLSRAFHHDLRIAAGIRVEPQVAFVDFHKCFHIASMTTFMSLCRKPWPTAVMGDHGRSPTSSLTLQLDQTFT